MKPFKNLKSMDDWERTGIGLRKLREPNYTSHGRILCKNEPYRLDKTFERIAANGSDCLRQAQGIDLPNYCTIFDQSTARFEYN